MRRISGLKGWEKASITERIILIALILTLLVFSVVLILEFRANKDSKTATKQVTEENNLEEKADETAPVTLHDKNTGFIFKLPEGFTYQERENYYLLTNEAYPDSCLVLMTSFQVRFKNGIEVYNGLKSLKERISYLLGGQEYKTALLDSNGSFEKMSLNHHEIIISSQPLLTQGGKELESTFYHLCINDKAICIGAVSLNCDTESPINDWVGSLIKDVKETGFNQKPYLDSSASLDSHLNISLGTNLQVNLPQHWERKVIQNGYVYRPPVTDEDPLADSVIVIFKDDSLTSNSFSVLDRTYELHGDVYAKALSQTQNGQDKLEKFSLNGSQEEVSINGVIYKKGEFNLTILPDNGGIYTTLPEKEVTSIHYARLLNTGETINFAFLCTKGYSYESMRILSEKIMETVE